MKAFGIIPARYASSRFPGKPLALIAGKPMIQRVYEQCLKSELSRVIVATDDLRIANIVRDFGGEVVMTSPDHASGTDRCGEASGLLDTNNHDVIVNIQGDEPFIEPKQINLLLSHFEDSNVTIATLASPLPHSDADDPNIVKVVFTKQRKAIYFSRFAIPFLRDQQKMNLLHYKHIGLYAYRYQTLQELVQLQESELEKAEKLEQLRWIENGYDIHLSVCEYNTISVDTPNDLLSANQWFQTKRQ